MVIDEIGVEIDDEARAFVRPWVGTYGLREELEEKIGPRLSPYLGSIAQIT